MHDSSQGRNAVELLAEEFVDRYRRGERPPLNEYTERYPEWAEEIRDLFPAMLMLENLKLAQPVATTEVSRPVQSAGEQLGDYRIIREVGRGGMGVVYEAEQVSLGRHVALKLLPREMVADAKRKLRFEREAKAAAKLHHTNIVPVFGVGETDGQLYYVMQFIQGMPLNDVLTDFKRQKGDDRASGGANPTLGSPTDLREATAPPQSLMTGSIARADVTTETPGPQQHAGEATLLDANQKFRTGSSETAPPAPSTVTASATTTSVMLPQRNGLAGEKGTYRQTTYYESIAQIGVQVASALEYAHGQGVLHRDIKPANLVLDRKGTVWVTDFGLAKMDDDRGLTQAGDILGTLRYMSPESFKGHSDARSEVYSLGLTLYELLALRPAFQQTNRNALIDEVMQAQVAPLKRLQPNIPADLQTIIHKAIERDPAHRYQSAKDLGDDLQRFLDDEPIQARQISAMERLVRWSRRNRGLAASLSTVAGLITVIALSSTIAAGYFQSLSGRLQTTVRNLTSTQKALQSTIGDLEMARNQATSRAAENLRLAEEAETARQASQTMLADMQTQRGLQAAGAGDSAQAMLWFANAATLTPHDPSRQAENQLRARNAMNEAVLPVALRTLPVQGEYTRFEFQPGGAMLLAVHGSNLLIWDWRLDQALPWSESLNGVADAVWSPDGRRLAVGFQNGVVQIRSFPAGEILQQLKVDEGLLRLALTPDGTAIATGGTHVELWNLTAEPVRKHLWPHSDQVHSLVFSRQGTRLMTAARDQLARVFAVDDPDLTSPALFPPLPHDPFTDEPPVFWNDEQTIVTVLPERSGLGWWDAASGERISTPPSDAAPFRGVRRLVASPDGRHLAAGTGTTAEVWDSDKTRRTLPHPNHVNDLVFTENGETLLTAGWDWMCRQWSLTAPDRSPATIPHLGVVQRCALSADSEYFAVGGNREVRIWKRPQPNIVIGQAAGWNTRFLRVRPGFDGRWATSGVWHEVSSGRTLRPTLNVIETQTGLPAGPVIPVNDVVDSCLCADNRSVAAVTNRDPTGALSLFDVATGQSILKPIPLPSPPHCVAARPGQPQLAVMCKSGLVVVIDQSTGGILQEHPHESVGTFHTARALYSPDGNTLIVLTANSFIHLRDAQTGKVRCPPIRPLSGGGSCRTLTVSADSRWLATGVNGENAVQVWDLATGAAVSEPLPHPGDFYGIFGIAFSPDGRWILSGNKDGRARLWDWKAGQQICPPLQHADEVLDVAFTPDGKHALTAVRNGRAHLWDLTTGKLTASPIDYPVPEGTSTDTVTVIGQRAIVGAAGYPVLNLAALLEKPALTTDALCTLAELATGARLEQGDLSSLATSEWSARWSALAERNQLTPSFAQTLADDLDRAEGPAVRKMIVGRAERSEALLQELARLRPDVVELQLLLGERAQRRGEATLAIQHFQQARSLAERHYLKHPQDAPLARQLAQLFTEDSPTTWSTLRPEQQTSRGGATLRLTGHGSTLVSGADVPEDRYTITAPAPCERIAAVLLDVLPDDSLPQNGPGRHASGNFQLSAIRLFRGKLSADPPPLPLPFADAWASYTYPAPRISVLGPIRPEMNAVWHVWGRTGAPHHAIYRLQEPLTVALNESLTIELDHLDIGTAINLGHFRFAVTDDEHIIDRRRLHTKVYGGQIDPRIALARITHQLGRFDLAEAAIKATFDSGVDSTSVEQLFGPLKENSAFLEWVMAKHPENPQLLTALGRDYRRQGETELAAATLKQAVTHWKRCLVDDPHDTAAATELAQLMIELQPRNWTRLEPYEMTATSGAKFTRTDEGTILAGDVTPQADTYTMRIRGPIPRLAALRLDVVPQSTLPPGGSGWSAGNFHLTEFRAVVKRADGAEIPLQFHGAAADIVRDIEGNQTTPEDGPWGAIDGNHLTRWDIWPKINDPHWLILQSQTPIELQDADELVIHLDFHDSKYPNARLGAFRLSLGADEHAVLFQQIETLIRRGHLVGQEALAGADLATGAVREALEILLREPQTVSADDIQRLWLLARIHQTLGDAEAATHTCQQLIERLEKSTVPRFVQPAIISLLVEIGELKLTEARRLTEKVHGDREVQ